MKLRMYKLKFQTPLRINPDVGEIFPRSDTIFAAVANVISEVEGEKSVKEFCESSPRFSSLFPYYGDFLFFPKPLRTPRKIESNRDLERKWKKKAWIERKLLEDGKGLVEVLEKKNRKNKFLADKEIPKFYQEDEVVRNAKNRITEQTQVFTVHLLRFTVDSGLFFLYFGDMKIDDYVKMLGEEGILGGKSVGFGKFAVRPYDFSWNSSGSWRLLLSLCIPDESEIGSLRSAYYSLVERSGWTGSYRKGKLRVLVEGSIVPELSGRIVKEVVGGIRIYRNYLSLSIPLGWWD